MNLDHSVAVEFGPNFKIFFKFSILGGKPQKKRNGRCGRENHFEEKDSSKNKEKQTEKRIDSAIVY